jgi:hypothetical protein
MPQSHDSFENLVNLMATPEPAELGPGPRAGVLGEHAVRERAAAVLSESALAPSRQQLILALLLLWHDHLEAGHAIAQEDETADGAFVHGIMHRREPDYRNAKYWFQRVGEHPAFAELAGRVNRLADEPAQRQTAQRLVREGRWDAFALVDACQAAAAAGVSQASARFLREVQKTETEVLLERFAKTGG